MNNRLQEIIKYKTAGRQNKFCELLGWSPQYLTKLLKGKDFGLTPIVTILETLPEINARWLLLGEGSMLCEEKITEVRACAQSYVLSIIELEKYLPVMSPTEVREFEQICMGEIKPNFSQSQIEIWKEKLTAHNIYINKKINDAICKQPKVKR